MARPDTARPPERGGFGPRGAPRRPAGRARGDIRRGREALRKEFGFLEDISADGGTAEIRFESADRYGSGDVAYDIGWYTLRVERADGSSGPPSRGKFITVWRRADDGQWLIRADGFSPAPPPGR